MGLSRVEFWGVLGIGVLVFLFGAGPIWQRPFAIDGPILWSYLVVVLLGWGVLGWRRRFGLKTALLSALELVLAKFVITLLVAVPLWAGREPPPVEKVSIPQTPRRAARQPSEIPAANRGRIEGRVLQDGHGVPEALVYVEHGLEPWVFAPSTATVAIGHDGRRLAPNLAVVQVGQPLLLESNDGQLHALVGSSEGGEGVLNLPVVARGRAKPYRADRALGLITLRCRVHEANGAEEPGQLLFLGHPFYARTDADGYFAWSDVPAGALSLRALLPDGSTARVQATLQASAQAKVELLLP